MFGSDEMKKNWTAVKPANRRTVDHKFQRVSVRCWVCASSNFRYAHTRGNIDFIIHATKAVVLGPRTNVAGKS